MAIDPTRLAADRLLDQVWRSGFGVANATTRADELSDALRCDSVTEGARSIVSDHHHCSSSEALSRIVFVARYTKRSIRDIARDVVEADGTDENGAAERPAPRPYRFTL